VGPFFSAGTDGALFLLLHIIRGLKYSFYYRQPR
jgi:hypothetical protein